ncbi:MAG: hypothetical protein KJP23_08230 [Deltaproteobacteria bacterium]|nr:hypothetical protein [Deltaproteobacteria bacterium]
MKTQTDNKGIKTTTIPEKRPSGMQRKTIIAAGIILLMTFANGCVFKESAIETTIEWARLAPLPVSHSGVDVEVTGSIFTRGFRVSFSTAPDQLESWLSASEGIADAEIYQEGDFDRYAIRPGGGAMFAEVRANRYTGDVYIRTFWS